MAYFIFSRGACRGGARPIHPRVRLEFSFGPRTDCACSGTCASFTVRQRRFLSQLPPASTRGAALFFRRGARPGPAPFGLPEGRRHAAGGVIILTLVEPGGGAAWKRADRALSWGISSKRMARPLALRARHSRAFSVLLNLDVALFKKLAMLMPQGAACALIRRKNKSPVIYRRGRLIN